MIHYELLVYLINVCIHVNVNGLLLRYCILFLEPSLSLTNLTTLLENVNVEESDQWWWIGDYLNIPQSKLNVIKHQHSSPDQRSCACWDLYISDHPSPSWKEVAYALYVHDCLEELEVLQKNYLKGELSKYMYSSSQ
jgi:hypothetical protein